MLCIGNKVHLEHLLSQLFILSINHVPSTVLVLLKLTDGTE